MTTNDDRVSCELQRLIALTGINPPRISWTGPGPGHYLVTATEIHLNGEESKTGNLRYAKLMFGRWLVVQCARAHTSGNHDLAERLAVCIADDVIGTQRIKEYVRDCSGCPYQPPPYSGD